MGGYAALGFPALAIKPRESPLQQFGQVENILQQRQQIAGEAQRQELGQVQLDQARLNQASESTLMRLWAENKGDYNQTLADAKASGAVTPEHLFASQKEAVAAQVQAARLTGEQLANHAKIAGMAANELDGLKGLPADQLPQAIKDSVGRLLQSAGPGSENWILPVAQDLMNNPSPENFTRWETRLMGSKWVNENQQEANKAAQSVADLTSAQTAAKKGVVELNALLQQLQDAHNKNVAETKQAATSTALQTEQLKQLRQTEEYIRKPDSTGFTTGLPVTEYNKRYDSFTNSAGYKQIQTLQGSYQQFGTILNDLDAGRPLTGAASVVALFNAIGISAEPLAGKGFRINSNTIQEHIGARGLDQAAYQKVLSLKDGDVITPQQIKDYASIAADVYKNAYVNSAEAHREGLPADFLPRGGGKMIDSTTAKIYANVVAHERPDLARNPAALQQAVMKAATDNGWTVQ